MVYTNCDELIPAEFLAPKKARDPRWEDSPFTHLQKLPGKVFGGYGEKIFSSIFTKLGHTVELALGTETDRIVDGLPAEIKSSRVQFTTNIHKPPTPHFAWNQIRPDQEPLVYYLNAFYPQRLDIWMLTKADIMENIAKGLIKHQHGGKKGDGNTWCTGYLPSRLIGAILVYRLAYPGETFDIG